MTDFRFVRHPLAAGYYEPEGIYLSMPVDGEWTLLQHFGELPDYHGAFTYAGIKLKGHPGVDFAVKSNSPIHAAERGRVTEVSADFGGLGRYIKLEHRWGETLYAQIGESLVESGQLVERGELMARTEALRRRWSPHLHFAMRTTPFNRYDGWGGFCDPLPYLCVEDDERLMQELMVEFFDEKRFAPLLPESKGMRRP
jgi:murein DD-endopeptidase MepM/ murein hydrolase activator NlpD